MDTEKARLYGEDKAIERWNGKGRSIEDDGYTFARADAKNHARKVQEMEGLLKDPANARIAALYRGLLTE